MNNYPKMNQCSCSNNSLDDNLKTLVSATRISVENSLEYALDLVRLKDYQSAMIFIKNAMEGIEILTA